MPTSIHSQLSVKSKSITKKTQRVRLNKLTLFKALDMQQPIIFKASGTFKNNMGFICESCLAGKKTHIFVKRKAMCKQHRTTLKSHIEVAVQINQPEQKKSSASKKNWALSDAESTNNQKLHFTKIPSGSEPTNIYSSIQASNSFECRRVTKNPMFFQTSTQHSISNALDNNVNNNLLLNNYCHLISNLKNTFSFWLKNQYLFITEIGLNNYAFLLATKYLTFIQNGGDILALKSPIQLDTHKELYLFCKYLELELLALFNFQKACLFLGQNMFHR